MDYSHVAILLLFVSLLLFVAEFFVPSGGVILILALAALAGSLGCAWRAWWDESRSLFWIHVLATVVSVPSTIGGVLWLLPRTRLGAKILLQAPEADEVVPFAREQERLQALVGRTGTTLTLLNPGGMVQVDRDRHHAQSEGGVLLEPDVPVEVVGVAAVRLVVRPVRASAPAHDAPVSMQAPSDDFPMNS
jgi:membrane-bound ClpP family serine protease